MIIVGFTEMTISYDPQAYRNALNKESSNQNRNTQVQKDVSKII